MVIKIRRACFVVFLCAVIALPVASFAEVTSQPCPYSCKTKGLNHKSCKDWKEGNTCFVDDMKPIQAAQASDNLERKIVMVNKSILAGERIEIKLPDDEPVDHLDAVVRREGGSTDTQLSASMGSGIQFGTKQVDRNDNHVVQFTTNGTRAEGRRLVLAATSGDVYVESIHVMTR